MCRFESKDEEIRYWKEKYEETLVACKEVEKEFEEFQVGWFFLVLYRPASFLCSFFLSILHTCLFTP
jgi:hypothetical protein